MDALLLLVASIGPVLGAILTLSAAPVIGFALFSVMRVVGNMAMLG